MNVVLGAAGNSLPLRLIAALGLFSLLYFCYQEGLNGPFLLDDFSSVLNAKINSLTISEITRALDTDLSAMFGRLLPVLSFSLNDYFGEGTAFSYKLTNLAIHATTAALMYCFLAKALTLIGSSENRFSSSTASILAFVCTAVWALHPLQISTVLYVVQRMAMLSALFTVLALWLFLILRTTVLQRTTYNLMVVGILVSIICACLSKENGVLAIPYLAFIELTILRFHGHDGKLLPKYRRVFYLLAATSGLIALVVFTMIQSNIMSGYVVRDYGVLQRLMTQPGVLLWYVQMIILPNISEMSLYHDSYPVQRTLGTTTVLAIGAWVAVLGITVSLYKKFPILGFGVGVFVISHSLESTFLPLELVFEHRNYFGMIGIILPIVSLVFIAARSLGYPNLLKFVGVTVVLQLSFLTHVRAIEWSDTVIFHRQAMIEKPGSIRALDAWTIHLASQGKNAETIRHLEYSHTVRPDSPHFLIQLLMFSGVVVGPNEPLFNYVQEQMRNNPLNTEEVASLNELLNYKYQIEFDWPTKLQIAGLYEIATTHSEKHLKSATEAILFGKYADILHATGQPEKALTAILQSIALDSNSPEALLVLAQLQFELDQVKSASATLQQLKQIDSHDRLLNERNSLSEQIVSSLFAESEGS